MPLIWSNQYCAAVCWQAFWKLICRQPGSLVKRQDRACRRAAGLNPKGIKTASMARSSPCSCRG
jgi:hypothetical protein